MAITIIVNYGDQLKSVEQLNQTQKDLSSLTKVHDRLEQRGLAR